MRYPSILGALASAFFFLAPLVANAADPAPIRHLEYSVSEHSTRTAQEESYDGVATGMQSRGYDGTMSIDVLAVAKDGGIVVKGAVWIQGHARPEEAVTCAVYGDGRVICPQDAPLSGTLHLVFSHLGRDFYDPSVIDANGKWEHRDDGNELSAHAQFQSTATKDANVVMIREHLEVVPKDQLADGFVSDTDIRYNTALSVPLSLHDVTSFTGRGSSDAGSDITDISLTKDSFAH